MPVDSEIENVRIAARFVLHDGSVYEGYVRAVSERWADIAPVREGSSRADLTPRVRFGGSPQAIVGQQRPCIFAGGKRLLFWCGGRRDVDELRATFYRTIPKLPEDVFPIHFQGSAAFATGIVLGEIEGFYEVQWGTKKSPRVVR